MKQLFYFSAEWCQPCKTLAPIMEQVAQTIPQYKKLMLIMKLM